MFYIILQFNLTSLQGKELKILYVMLSIVIKYFFQIAVPSPGKQAGKKGKRKNIIGIFLVSGPIKGVGGGGGGGRKW